MSPDTLHFQSICLGAKLLEDFCFLGRKSLPFSGQVLVGEVRCHLQQFQVVRSASNCHLTFLRIYGLFWQGRNLSCYKYNFHCLHCNESAQTRDQKSFLAYLFLLCFCFVFIFKLGFVFQEIVLLMYLGNNTLLALLSILKMKNGFMYFYR